MNRPELARVSGSALFASLPQVDHQRLLDICELVHVNKRDVIVRQGDTDRCMYIVLSGAFRVSVVSPEGKEISLDILEENDAFGEMALFDGMPRSAMVTATRSGQLLVLRREPFISLLGGFPDMAIRLLEVMSLRLRSADELYEDSVFLEVPGRLAKWITRLGHRHGTEHPDGIMIDMQLSQYELGTLANASRESVNKQLKAWEAEGLIDTGRGWILVRDQPALAALAVEAD
jgi:CRP/FNR family cyclic AMP-dependent transcriptional regulator